PCAQPKLSRSIEAPGLQPARSTRAPLAVRCREKFVRWLPTPASAAAFAEETARCWLHSEYSGTPALQEGQEPPRRIQNSISRSPLPVQAMAAETSARNRAGLEIVATP